MKKILIPSLSLFLLYACSGNKVKDKPVTKVEEKSQVTTPDSEMSADDKLIIDWLQEKEWKAESEAAPITTMKLYKEGQAEFVYGKDTWVYKNGFFAMRSLNFVKWPFKKIDDQTFTLFVEPSQKTFNYKFVRNL